MEKIFLNKIVKMKKWKIFLKKMKQWKNIFEQKVVKTEKWKIFLKKKNETMETYF